MRTRSIVIRRSRSVVRLLALAAFISGASLHAAEDAAERVIATGKVVDDDGKAVAGVRVSAEAWEPVEPATSGVDGTFRLSLPINNASRIYALLVARSGDGRLGLKSVSFDAAKPEPISISVKPARPL